MRRMAAAFIVFSAFLAVWSLWHVAFGQPGDLLTWWMLVAANVINTATWTLNYRSARRWETS